MRCFHHIACCHDRFGTEDQGNMGRGDMRAGELDRIISLQTATVTHDAAGQPIETWKGINVPAHIKRIKGGERFTADQDIGKESITFKIRYRTIRPTVLNRIVYLGRNWDIHDVRELGRREGLEIDATARSE
jgi:SPP1 family predicted phage head-tail adaptor